MAWGTGSFDNDDAMDFYFCEFIPKPEKKVLMGYLFHKDVMSETNVTRRAVAAAEIIALYKAHTPGKGREDDELAAAFDAHPLDITPVEYAKVADVMHRVVAESKLRTVWQTVFEDVEGWEKAMHALIERLER